MTSPPTADSVADTLLPALGALRRLLRRLAGASFDGTVSPSQREVLVAVAKAPGSAVAEIAHELGLAPNTVSTLVTQLAAAGLLDRTTDERDRRVGRLRLSPAAADAVAQTRDRRRALLGEALTRLGPATVADLTAGVGAITALTAELRALEASRS